MPPRSSNQDEIDTNEEEVWSGHNEDDEEVSNGSLQKESDEIGTNENGKESTENFEVTVEQPKVGMMFDTPDGTRRKRPPGTRRKRPPIFSKFMPNRYSSFGKRTINFLRRSRSRLGRSTTKFYGKSRAGWGRSTSKFYRNDLCKALQRRVEDFSLIDIGSFFYFVN
ncbi:hypothetical protein RHGRI_023031 [Rhododendron griersonianum]|uniref:Uncharacterized protein n=1 Tax=Rhododendron griersonianum TaxID=479676 RepID=A0AAV6J7G9_9ERIC|nr:hypothetical protein RHGRI_023031 [Rhododendron griersonianum]